MKGAKLGRLRQLDIRRFWDDQDSDFRSWLSQEENMALLGEAVGLELEPLARDPEAAASHSELLCRDTVSDQWIVVAADAEDTDDARLGQVLAQAAGLNAGTVIWLSRRFGDAQRAALDWLNEITDTRFYFFGLEVELWQIEDSPAAPRFSVVAKPNDWTKTLGERPPACAPADRRRPSRSSNSSTGPSSASACCGRTDRFARRRPTRRTR